jgi:hypothetical protein
MSVKCGKTITCDRCGKSVFLNQVEYETPFTIDEYEPAPEGWERGFDSDLCPDCYGEYLKLKKSFFLNKPIRPSENEMIKATIANWLIMHYYVPRTFRVVFERRVFRDD